MATCFHCLAAGAAAADLNGAALYARGEMLSRQICVSCHLYPEPNILDKNTWIRGALPKMAPFLGLARVNYAARPDGEILRRARVFPDAPALSEADWRAICFYYWSAAPERPLPQGPRARIDPALKQFRAHEWNWPGPTPLVTLVNIDSARHCVWISDWATHDLAQIDSSGHLKLRVPLDSSAVSLFQKGPDFYLTLIGRIYPSDELAGAFVRWPFGTGAAAKPLPLLTQLRRPIETVEADLNGDGRPDWVVCEFGNVIGELCWYENLGGGTMRKHVLAERPGAEKAVVYDLDHDGRPDIIALLAQAREGIYWFRNLGHGEFEEHPLLQWPPIYGTTYFEMADFNGDGWPDFLVANGDNGEYPSPTKFYHGLRIYLNDGKNQFHEAWFYPLNGAFKAVAGDFDGDGHLDIAAISFFPDYEKSPEESFVYLENLGGLKFKAWSLPEALDGRWLTMDVGDVDGDGDLDIVLGSFLGGPPSRPIPPPIATRWRTHGVRALYLENLKKR